MLLIPVLTVTAPPPEEVSGSITGCGLRPMISPSVLRVPDPPVPSQRMSAVNFHVAFDMAALVANVDVAKAVPATPPRYTPRVRFGDPVVEQIPLPVTRSWTSDWRRDDGRRSACPAELPPGEMSVRDVELAYAVPALAWLYWPLLISWVHVVVVNGAPWLRG